MKGLPVHLHSTLKLLQKSFPSGIKDKDISDTVIAHLYEHMSDRQLSQVMSVFLEINIDECYNNILRVASEDVGKQALEDIEQVLNNNGFREWLAED